MQIKDWILVILATIGKVGRVIFNEVLLEKLSANDIPAALKVAWNECIAHITTAQ